MENYKLKDDEVIIFRDEVAVAKNEKSIPNKQQVELILTNYNYVFVTTTKKFLTQETTTEEYPIKDTKFFDEKAYVTRKGKMVVLCVIGAEKFIIFKKTKSAKEFTDKAQKLVTGYNKMVRGVKQVQKTVKETNEALDIDVVQIAKTVAGGTMAIAGGVAEEMAKSSNAGKGIKFIATVSKVFRGGKEKTPQISEKSGKSENE